MSEQEIKDAVKEAKRQYYREYRKKNRERIMQNNERFWLRRAEKERCKDHAEITRTE